MKIFKPAMFALLAAFAMAAPAHAQMENEKLGNNTYFVVMPDGRTVKMEAKDKMTMDMMMKEGKPVAAGQIFFMSGGKLYMMEDKKMSDGKMLFEHIGGRA